MSADLIIGRTVTDVVTSDNGQRVTLVLDDGTHARFEVDGDYDTLDVAVLDGRLRVAEVIARRVAEYEAKIDAARRAERAEADRIVRERMERLLPAKAYREWVRRHQPGYLMAKAIKETWSLPALERQLYGSTALIPLASDAE